MPYKVVIADKVDLIRDIYENAIMQSEGYTLAASFGKPAQEIKALKPEVKIIVTAVLPNAEDVTQAQKAGIEGLWTVQADEKAFLVVMCRVMAGEKVYP